MDRLVLGSGSLEAAFVERLTERPGSLVVLVDDDRRVQSLRESGVDARNVDPTDPNAVRAVAGPVDSVVVLPSTFDRARSLAATARSAYPGAFVLACLDGEADPTAVAEHADRVVEGVGATASHTLEWAGDSGVRVRRLQSVLRDVDGTLGVFAHDNPDPDAIASAVCLRRIAEWVGTDAEVCYYGGIDHQENRALVNLLEYDLRNLDADADLGSFAGFALVDHSRPDINSGLPEETPIDVVIDHHPPRAPVEARFVDLRSDVGATCTLLVDYLQQFGIEPASDLATGLLYGLRTDTKDFSRELSTADFEAAAMLVGHADSGALQRIESPSVSGDTLDTVADAVRNRRVDDDVVTTCIDRVTDRDALAQAADRLLEMEGISTTLVFGYTEEAVFLSARSRDGAVDIGEVLREGFGRIGSAGGHDDMAGAQIPVGILSEGTDDDERGEIIEEVVVDRFFEALGNGTRRGAVADTAFFRAGDGR